MMGRIEDSIKRMQGSIDFSLDNEEDLDAVSWIYQEGVLISVNDAILLLELINRCQPDKTEIK